MTRKWIGVSALVLVAGVFFFSALSGDVYEMTTPWYMPHHILMRKLYSIIAFAAVAFLSTRVLRRRSRWYVLLFGVLVGAGFSGLIEIVQSFTSDESLKWHVFDLACGALGGAVAGLIAGRSKRAGSPDLTRDQT